MNILIHGATGIIGELLFPSSGLFFIGCICPDVILLKNEIKLRVARKEFAAEKVGNISYFLYKITHSILFFCFCFLFLNKIFAIGILCHQLMDWFSHCGRFETQPFYPITNKTVKELLKCKRQ